MLARARSGLARPCAVYAAYDPDGHVIYIGQSYNPEKRWEQHESQKPWIGEMTGGPGWTILSWHPSKAEALAEEARLIRRLCPRWNIDGSPVAAEVRQRYLDTFGWAPDPKPTVQAHRARRALWLTVKVVAKGLWFLLTGVFTVLGWVLCYFLGGKRRRRRRR